LERWVFGQSTIQVRVKLSLGFAPSGLVIATAIAKPYGSPDCHRSLKDGLDVSAAIWATLRSPWLLTRVWTKKRHDRKAESLLHHLVAIQMTAQSLFSEAWSIHSTVSFPSFAERRNSVAAVNRPLQPMVCRPS
jgi:hypothetical protein